jgi:hypothetical protein
MKDQQRRFIAFHEAGHVAAAWEHGIRVNTVTIISTDDAHGHVKHQNPLRGINIEVDGSDRARIRAERLAAVCLAGPIAQRIWNARSWRQWHGYQDHQTAYSVISAVSSSDRHAEMWLRTIAVTTEDMLRVPHIWGCVTSLADALMAKGWLAARDVRTTIQSTLDGRTTRAGRPPA